MSIESRKRLQHAQDQLVTSLMQGGDAPPGFKEEDLASAARSLLAKRRRLVQLAWPVFETTLSGQFISRFNEYARQAPLFLEAQGRQDGARFARWLLQQGQLPDPCRLALMQVELEGITRPRRGVAVRFAWLKERRRLAMGIKLPFFHSWVFPGK